MDNSILFDFYFDETKTEYGKETLDVLNSFSTSELLLFIRNNYERINTITKGNITQFSDICAVDQVLKIVKAAESDIDFLYVGYMFNKKGTEGSQRKYGENHIKLTMQMGLITNKPYRLNELGNMYLGLNEEEQRVLKPKLYLRVPVVQAILSDALSEDVDGTQVLLKTLKESTAIRRRSNIKRLIAEICKELDLREKNAILKNLSWS